MDVKDTKEGRKDVKDAKEGRNNGRLSKNEECQGREGGRKEGRKASKKEGCQGRKEGRLEQPVPVSSFILTSTTSEMMGTKSSFKKF
jgi:hypothetical protein